mmetsp:Transcript_13241/g.31770  ORF Transcript_13241/g.31770 Transcript_13241/m.31770 type:complete len:570 (+) Transcript_13241:716-2425(+)|eukprot:CAMPEP_0113614808 /NCGR_PEP_ID=MMETSP0017_2-20120614/7366_1 /TAXON_ID=2856 /ORGANISM="Cylindrotheca closterium" /LENGTH=569 /DNA_ID=CAMNT_0000524005 /DNA_START=161 /DNA_END=1870 /DNA_ORIENTATION=+ /assembly_acc=CAM_ASM_000147
MLRNRHSISGLPTNNAEGGSFGSQHSGGGGYGGGAAPNYQQSGGSYGGYSGGNAHSNNGYGGYSHSQSSMSSADDKYASKKRSSSSNSIMQAAPLIGCAVFFVWALTVTMMNWSKGSQLKQIYKEAGSARNVQDVVEYIQAERRRAFDLKREAKDSIREHTDKHSSKVNLLQDQIKSLTQHRDQLVDKHESEKAKERKREKREIREWREEAYYDQIQLLESRVKKDAKRIILERFGPGPHKVAMYFQIPDGNGNLGPEQRMVIQLAPLDLVPHAVHFFMEQVEHGLWNSENYVYLNGPHVLQIGPQVWEEDYGEMTDDEYEERRVGHFYELGLEELIFPDYSDDYPHAQYTLGFTGRPGGPDFYINKVNNEDTHGPGGQDQHALDHQADSCFGMVVEGTEVLQLIFNAKTYEDKGWEWMIEEPIPITRAEILTKRPASSARVLPASTTTASGSGATGGITQEQAMQNLQQQQQHLQQSQTTQHHAHPHHQTQNSAEQQFQQQQQQPIQSSQQQQQYQQQNQQAYPTGDAQYHSTTQQQQQQQQQQNYDGNHQAQGHRARLPPEHGRVTP